METLNRSAIEVKPKQRFLDWLHAIDPQAMTLPCSTYVRTQQFT